MENQRWDVQEFEQDPAYVEVVGFNGRPGPILPRNGETFIPSPDDPYKVRIFEKTEVVLLVKYDPQPSSTVQSRDPEIFSEHNECYS